MGLKQFSQSYCFVVGQAKSAHFNCDGSVQYYSDYTCTTPSFKTLPESPSDTCLYVAPGSGSGKAIQYTCNTVPSKSWITVTAYGDKDCTQLSNGWVTYACNTCVKVGNHSSYYKFTCSQSEGTITYAYNSYNSSTCSHLNQSYTPSVKAASTCVVRNPGQNPVELGDLTYTSYYLYAKYTLVSGKIPPAPPASGYFIK